MASIREKLLKKYGGKDDSKEQAQQSSPSYTSTTASKSGSVRAKLLSKYNPTYDHVSSDFVSQFFKDAQSYLNNTQSSYEGMEWTNRDSAYSDRKTQTDDLRARSWDIRQYLEQNKGSMEEEDYNHFIGLLDDFDRSAAATSYSFYKRKGELDKHETEADYKEWQKQQDINSMSMDEYMAKIYDADLAKTDIELINSVLRSYVPMDGYGDNATEDETRKYNEFRQNVTTLWERYGKDKYDTVEDFYYAELYGNSYVNIMEEAEKRASGIAYTTKDGANVTWQMLYDNKASAKDLSDRYNAYSQNADWSELSKGIDVSADPDRQQDYDIVFELSRSNVAYDKETALANGTSEEEWNDIDQKRRYIGEKYGVDLYADTYSNVNIFNEIMAMLDEKSWGGGELSTQLDDDIVGDQTFINMRHLTKEEKAVLNYIFFTQGRDAALEWHNSRMDIYQNRANGVLTEEMFNWGKDSWGGIGAFVSPASLASVAMSLGSGVEQVFDWIGGDNNNSLARASSAIRAGVSEGTDVMIGNFDAFDFVYNTAMSGADSLAASLLPGSAGSVLLGLSAAAQATNDALDRGLSNKQAFWSGLAAGVFEGVFEKYSIGNFKALQEVPSATWKGIAKNLAKTMLVNASEEMATEVANQFYDIIVNMDLSKYETMVRQLEEQGMSPEDARNKAFWSTAGQIGEAGASGAFMGLGFGGIGSIGSIGPVAGNTAVNTYNYINTGKRTDLAALQGVAGQYTGNKTIDKASTKAAKKGTAYRTGKLHNAVASEVYDQTKADFSKALRDSGVSGKAVDALSTVFTDMSMGYQLSNEGKELLDAAGNDPKIRSVYNQVMAEGGTTAQRIAQLSDTGKVTQTKAKTKSAPAAQESAVEQVSEETIEPEEDLGDGTFVISSGENVETIDVAKISGKKTTVTINGKSTVPLSDVSFANEVTAAAFDVVTSVPGMTANAANAILNNPNLASPGFLEQAIRTFDGGVRNDQLLYKKINQDIISPEDAREIFNAGREAAAAKAKADEGSVYDVYKKAKGVLEKSGKKPTGELRVADDVDVDSFTDEQTESAMLAAELAPALSLDIVLYEGRPGEFGYYSSSEDAIYLNVNAKWHGKSMMLFTLGHELVHRAKRGSHRKFQAFADYLIAEYGKKGIDLDDLIAEQLAAAKRAGIEMTEPEAFEEVVCDAAQKMLVDTDAGKKLAEWGAKSRENQGIVEQIRKWLTELFDNLRTYFHSAEVDSRSAKAFDLLDKNVQQILADMFVDMSKDAAEKLGTIKAAGMLDQLEKTRDISYNLAAAETHMEKLASSITSQSSVPLDVLQQRYSKILRMWEKIGIKLNSNFLNEWNSKVGTDRTFNVFKAQSGYKYNIELSTMCKKGVPLFEAIDTIVRNEIMKELDTDTLGKAEKEILYDILKSSGFEIPCAICYVEQARQREGVIIDAFLNGKDGKLGWNSVLDAIESGMRDNGVDFSFESVSRNIATDNYTAANLNMDKATQDAFFSALMVEANKEITRYNKANKKDRALIKSPTKDGIQKALKGNVPANLKVFKVLAMNPGSRFRIDGDLLYSSNTTRNLASAHQELYSLFNSQGGVSGYKTKQTPVVYWGDLLEKKWRPSDLRRGGGIRNQSNSDLQMYTLLDQVQMYIDLTAKGYYLQAYTKVVSELKLLGLSGAKINASLIPKVVVYFNTDGTVNFEKTSENAGLDEKGNPIFDDIEGIDHKEAFMLLEDPGYSENVGGVCIGYSDNHIRKLLDDPRIQMVIGFHDKTNNPDKRYRGARYAKNYNGLNEARQLNSDGKYETVHVNFSSFLNQAEKMFRFDKSTETYEGTITYNGKEYNADDIPKLAADLYLEKYDTENAKPAYEEFKDHENYYKLLADFSLHDSQGHYSPHRKVAYNMPDTVPYLDANGNKQTMKTEDYIQAELEKEMSTRDSLALALADDSPDGIIPQFKAKIKESTTNPDIRYKLAAQEDYAPTFYSKMQNVVEGMKQEKFGASSVVSMLRGRGVKVEEIKWSGIEEWLEGKKSVTKSELQEFIAGSMLQIEEQVYGDSTFVDEDGDTYTESEFKDMAYELADVQGYDAEDVTFEDFGSGMVAYIGNPMDENELLSAERMESSGRWEKYKLDSGDNYREIVFTLPNSSYSNQIMRTHWGEDAEGVLAHARIQDFDVNGKKMLFIEEIQSDWHNEGHKHGYDIDAITIRKRIAELTKQWDELYEKMLAADAVAVHGINEKMDAIYEERNRLEQKVRFGDFTPDAPFKDTYHEYVLKRLLREAAENGYDSIGWTPAQTQVERWSKEFAEGYRIEYDQDIPKFLRKYGKKWGTTVGKTVLDNGTEVWSMDITDAMKESVLHQGQELYKLAVGVDTSPEALLENASEENATPGQRHNLKLYRDQLEVVNNQQKALKKARDNLKKAKAAGATDSEIRKLRIEESKETNRLNTHKKYLDKIIQSKPIQELLVRERDAAEIKHREAVAKVLAEMRSEYGTIPSGEKAVRDDSLPVSTDGNNRVSRSARTVKGAAVTTDELAETIDFEVANGRLTYMPITNEDTAAEANTWLENLGWEAAKESWKSDVNSGKTGAKVAARGAVLLNNAAQAGDKQAWLDILYTFQKLSTNTAQGLQAMRILKQLEPTDKLYMAERSVKQMVEDMHLQTPITLDQELVDRYKAAETDEQRDEIMGQIQQDVADQLPASLIEKFTALRYLNMLGNLRTQIRNLFGNATMLVTGEINNAVAASLERIVSATYQMRGEEYNRSRSVVVSKTLREQGKEDYENIKALLLDGGRYSNENAQSSEFARNVQKKRKIFKFKPIEGYRKATNWATERGDLAFSQYAYVRYFARYLKARGINDVADASVEMLDDARLFAVRAAQEQTFRDVNWLSGWLSGFLRDQKTPTIARVLGDGIMPFRKTPANILMRAVEYSPAGALVAAAQTGHKIVGNTKLVNKNGAIGDIARSGQDITGDQLINNWAKGLTGSGMFALGMLFYSLGLITGGADDDEGRENMEELHGRQNYAVTLPGGFNFTIDWMAPSVIPVLMGVELMQEIQDDGFQLKDLESALTSIGEPLVELSMLQGVSDALDNVRYAENNLVQMGATLAINYLTQGLTNSFLGQLERTFQDSRETTYVDKDSAIPGWLQRSIGSALGKVPFLDYNQIPYINEWGEEEESGNIVENALSPSYVDSFKPDPVYDELMRLDAAQDDKNVFPSRPKITYTDPDTDEKRYLSADEYVELAKVQGRTQRKLVEEVISNPAYKKMSDADKAKVISFVYKYAKEKAQIEVLGRKEFSAKWLNAIGTGDPVYAIIAHVQED